MIEADPLVYYYSHRGWVVVTRTRSGVWKYKYTISKLFDIVNKKEGSNYSKDNPSDWFMVGSMFGHKLKDVMEYCHKSYDKSCI